MTTDHTPRCPKCGFVAKNATGLSSHERKHRDITPPQMDATGTLVAPAERRRRAAKEPAQQAPVSIGSRRCTGSKTFGIPEHQAPAADFPVQPSRKDGLGTMCKPHWTEYTGALRKAAIARKGEPTEPRAPKAPAAATEPRAPRTRPAKEPTIDPALAAAERLLQDVDALPGPEHIKAIGTDEVQAAFATVARGRGHAEPEEVAVA